MMASGSSGGALGFEIKFSPDYLIKGKTYITWMNELCQKWSLRILFSSNEVIPGVPDPNRFRAECTVMYQGKPILASGYGDTKKKAMQVSGFNMMSKLQITETALANPGSILKPVDLLAELILMGNEIVGGTDPDQQLAQQQLGPCPSPTKMSKLSSKSSSESEPSFHELAKVRFNNKKVKESQLAELKSIEEMLVAQNVKPQRIQKTKASNSTSVEGNKILTDQSYTAKQTEALVRSVAGDTIDGLHTDNIPFNTCTKIIEAIVADAKRNNANVSLEYISMKAAEESQNKSMSLVRFVVDGHAVVAPGVGCTVENANENAAMNLTKLLHDVSSPNRWI